ncbi:MAG: UbiX family flavin prenyltransferase [Propionibacteriaceae bacterium]|nr:UbiX family flavin prenyltransferase [Propionibacteriaceae bacterium]
MVAKRLIVGVSGASGVPLAVEILKSLRSACIESHLVITDAAIRTIFVESEVTPKELCDLADVVHTIDDFSAPIASGSFPTCGMVVVPCSMKTLAGIWSGYSDNLLLRAADVTLKEQRKLVLVVRESPLSQIHLRNMLDLSRMGAVILPAMLSYYGQPKTIDDVAKNIVGKVFDQFGLDYPDFARWQG